MIAFNFGAESVGDRVVVLNKGWNLIGYSSKEMPSSEVSVLANIEEAVQIKASYYDSDKGSYQLASLEEGEFEPNRGYWVYSNLKDVELTLRGVGGAEVGVSKSVNDLVFRNEVTGEELGLVDAKYLWGIRLQRYDVLTGSFLPVKDIINSWEGYFVMSSAENITIME